MQSEAVKDMPETIELGYFYIGAPMSEYFYSVMDDETRLQGMQPLRKAVYVRQEAAKSPASAVEVVTVEDAAKAINRDFCWRYGINYDEYPEPFIFDVEHFLTDSIAKVFPNGLKIEPPRIIKPEKGCDVCEGTGRVEANLEGTEFMNCTDCKLPERECGMPQKHCQRAHEKNK